MIGSNHFALRICDVIDETADAKSFVFDVPTALASAFRYKAGQFLTVQVPYEGKVLSRCYSLASSPAADEKLKVTVKRVTNGRVSNWMCDTLRPGDSIDVQAPSGVFTPKTLDGKLLLFAGGCGITPVFSILHTTLLAGTGHMLLVYASRDAESVIFRDAIDKLVQGYPGRLSVEYWLDSEKGVPTAANLADLVGDWIDAQSYTCGPAPFMETVVAALDGLGIPLERIHLERFLSLSETEPTEISAAPAPGSPVRIEVDLEGAVMEVAGSGGEPLLDSMLRAGVDVPNSCRTGECSSCRCKVESGSVQLRKNDALSKKELADGWTLACQALPTSESVKVRFEQ